MINDASFATPKLSQVHTISFASSTSSNTSQKSSSISSTTTSSNNQSTTSNQNITRLLEEGEKINHIYRCARVQGLDTTEGVFLFGKEHFYILDGYTLVSSRDIVDIDSLKSSNYEPLIPKGSTGTSGTAAPFSNWGSSVQTEKTCNKFAYEDIR